jgi:hypothetical protein
MFIDNLYKFFDVNTSMEGNTAIADSNQKMHLSLLNIIEYYFTNIYYEEALQGKRNIYH